MIIKKNYVQIFKAHYVTKSKEKILLLVRQQQNFSNLGWVMGQGKNKF